tara:strand:- start:713 stop:904 length:192 start_codon:yes stop_codon:yes gene_type:complete
MIIKVLDLALIIGLSFTGGILTGIFIMFNNFINIYSTPTPEEPTIVTACPANTLRSEEIIIRK